MPLRLPRPSVPRLIFTPWEVSARLGEAVFERLGAGRTPARAVWSAADGESVRHHIEVTGLRGDTDGVLTRAIESALERYPGVRWARVTAPLDRVVVATDAPGPQRDELFALIDRAVTENPAGADRAPAHPTAGRPLRLPATILGADVVGLGLSAAGQVLRRPALAPEIASILSFVDLQPRARGWLEAHLGSAPTNYLLGVGGALTQGLSQGVVGLSLDAAQRLAQLGEARARREAWVRAEPELAGHPDRARGPALDTTRPGLLPSGPVERYADQAAVASLIGAGSAVVAGQFRRSAKVALTALPKAGALGRESFASILGRALGRRGVVVLDSRVLRQLDRIDTVVLDEQMLRTGQLLLGEIRPLPASRSAEPSELVAIAHGLFRADDPLAVQSCAPWRLGPVPELAVRGRTGSREGRQLRQAGAEHVIGVARDRTLLAVASVVPEPEQAADALAAAARRAGVTLVVAGAGDSPTARRADERIPGGAELVAGIRARQEQGAGVLLVSRDRRALAQSDCGIGVAGPDGTPAWGAHVLVGNDLVAAAILIEAVGVARRVSSRSVAFARAGTGIGVAITVSSGTGLENRPMLPINTAAALAAVWGGWQAHELARRPIIPPPARIPWHEMPVQVVLDRLASDVDGLTSEEVRRRRTAGSGPLPAPNFGRAFLEELNNPLTPILAGGAALSAAIGSVIDAGLVVGLSTLSALVGGVQRSSTDRAVAELLAASATTARVRRDGTETVLPADELVPGDVVLLGAGDVVPADCRMLDGSAVEADESALTGESFPVVKRPDPVIAHNIADRSSMLYEGTTLAAGRAVAVVAATGASTEAGRSMAATRGAAPPAGVEARLARITNVTLPLALGSAGAVVGAGLLRGQPARETLGAGVSLAVASVPEGLPFLVSAAQLAAARRLSRVGALVRNPRTIEALGRVDVLCFDKTGTLTEGRIRLGAVCDGRRTLPASRLDPRTRQVLAAGLRATPTPRSGRFAHLTDRAVSHGADAATVTRQDGAPGWRRTAALPFEPSRGFHATRGRTLDSGMISVKGAPEVVLPRCTRVGDGSGPLDDRRRRQLAEQLERLAGQGYRVLAVAERPAESTGPLDDADAQDLAFLGFLALTDPVRGTAGRSVSELRAAGVQVVMITGDHPTTAAAIATELDVLNGGRVVTGADLDRLDDEGLDAVLPQVCVVARGTPAHKVRVVQAFQRLGRTVAMTGDGANDAPAIRLADVGIALGRRGTPAARAAADLVVTDDQLETILAALVEGRAMWKSVRQALAILVGGNLGEIGFTVLGALLTGTSPLTARQLLLVNLLTDLAPALAVALRAPDSESTHELLAEGPEASLGTALTREIALRSVATAFGATSGWLAARATGREARARTVALTALVGTQLGQTVVVGRHSPAVIGSGLGSAAALALVIQTPGLSQFFGCTPLGPVGWTIAGGSALAGTTVGLLAPRAIPLLRPLLPARLLDLPEDASELAGSPMLQALRFPLAEAQRVSASLREAVIGSAGTAR